ncbi:MAG: tetratricopeptide repeat protein [bacterium]|nr:tetratricopeptide repeat protein [bacterium]
MAERTQRDNGNKGKIIDLSAIIQKASAASADHASADNVSFSTHVARGYACRENGDNLGALAEFAKAYAINDSNVDLCLDLGTTLGELQRYENATFYLKRAVELDPDNAEAHYFLGMAYMAYAQPHFRHAIKELQLCLSLDSSLSRVNIFIAEAWRALKKPQQAKAILKEIVEKDSADTEALNLLAVIHLESGDIEESIALLRRAIAANPSSATLYINLGVAYLHRGFIDMSAQQFRTAIKLNPLDANAFYNLAHTLALRGDPDQAEKHVRSAIALDDSNPAFHLLLSSTLMSQEKWSEAMQTLVHVLEQEAGNPLACGSMGRCLQETGDIEEAKYWYEQAIELDEYNPEWYFYLAFCHIQEGKLEFALQQIDTAISINDQIGGYYILRGDILYNLGKKRKAEKSWRTAEELTEELAPDVAQRLSGDVPQMPQV